MHKRSYAGKVGRAHPTKIPFLIHTINSFSITETVATLRWQWIADVTRHEKIVL